MRKGNYKPIPREEPTEDEPVPEGPPTVRPPEGPIASTHPGAPTGADYQSLRASCRAATAGEAVVDDELAVEAEILRLAMDRGRSKSGTKG